MERCNKIKKRDTNLTYASLRAREKTKEKFFSNIPAIIRVILTHSQLPNSSKTPKGNFSLHVITKHIIIFFSKRNEQSGLLYRLD